MTRINITPNQYDLATLVLRVAFGGFMLYSHGWSKLLKLFGEGPIKFADPFGLGAVPSLYMAVFAEFVCAALIVVGLKTRLATVPLIITMAVAAFIIHAPDPFARKEMALMYLAGYIVIALLGGGRYSLDDRLS